MEFKYVSNMQPGLVEELKRFESLIAEAVKSSGLGTKGAEVSYGKLGLGIRKRVVTGKDLEERLNFQERKKSECIECKSIKGLLVVNVDMYHSSMVVGEELEGLPVELLNYDVISYQLASMIIGKIYELEYKMNSKVLEITDREVGENNVTMALLLPYYIGAHKKYEMQEMYGQRKGLRDLNSLGRMLGDSWSLFRLVDTAAYLKQKHGGSFEHAVEEAYRGRGVTDIVKRVMEPIEKLYEEYKR